jgi:hypothetical protein
MASLFGLTHHIINTVQYSYLIAAVIASALAPTLAANILYPPRHLTGKEDPGEHGRKAKGDLSSASRRDI